MMRAVGQEASPVEVARMYRNVCAGFVLDNRDRGLAPDVEKLGLQALVMDTVMSDGGTALAARILEAFTSRASWRP
jgi:hypothetical protein